MAKQRRPASAKTAPAESPRRTATQPDAASREGFRDIGIFLLLLCVTLAAYWPALQGGPLWDDENHVTRPELQSLHGLWRIWSDLRAVPQYYPLLHSAFWLEHKVWADHALGYHLTSLFLHVIAAGLLFLILKKLALPGAPLSAWLAAFIFALHPIEVEALAWISEQKSTLSAVFYLASALTYLYFDQTRRKAFYLAASGLFVLALLSKTVTATLPPVLLVIFWWRRAKISWKQDVLPLLPWFVVGSGAGIFTAWVERTLIGARGAEFALTLSQRGLLAGRVIWFYLGKLIWPVELTFTYPRWIVDPRLWWQYVFPAGTLIAAAGLLLFARKHRGLLASFLIFVGTLFPALGFLNVYPFRYSYVADHFQYLAGLAIIVPAAVGLTWIALQALPKSANIPFAAALVAVFAVLTWRQSHMYRDAETLYRETIARNPSVWLPHNNLGHLLARTPERLPEAIAEYETARRIDPAVPEPHLSLGSAFAQMPERASDAITEYQTALRLKPDYTEAHLAFANLLAHLPGRLEDAIFEYQAALRLQPDLPLARLNLGNALRQIPGHLPDAIAEYEAALRLWPEFAEAHYNLGSALAQIPARTNEAVAEFQAALRCKPDFEAARRAIQYLQTNPQ